MGQWYCLWLRKTVSFCAFIYSCNKYLSTMYWKVIKYHHYMQESIAHTIFIMPTLSKKSKRPFLILSVLYYMFLLIWPHAAFPVSFFPIVPKIDGPNISNCSWFPKVFFKKCTLNPYICTCLLPNSTQNSICSFFKTLLKRSLLCVI